MSHPAARFLRILVLALALTPFGLAGCGDSLGEPCFSNDDCGGDTFCCADAKCSHGMCTIGCSGDRDCPDDMICRDGKFCLFTCGSDRDCADGFRCKEKDGRRSCEGD